jgi:hypothetical protein
VSSSRVALWFYIKEDGSKGVLTEEKDEAMITWKLTMDECGLSTSLQQLKTKVAKLT